MLLNWSPPSEYDIPAMFNSSTIEDLLESLKTSIRSISNTGLIIMSIPVACIIIYVVIKSFTSFGDMHKGSRSHSMSRNLFKPDASRNMSDIMDEKRLNNEIGLFSNINFHEKHIDLGSKNTANKSNVLIEKKSLFKQQNDSYYEKKGRK